MQIFALTLNFIQKKEPLPLGKDSLLVRSAFERTQLFLSIFGIFADY